jgi:hypothetical protein
MAAKDSSDSQSTAFERSVFLDSLERVCGAGRIEAAGLRLEGRDNFPVDGDEEHKGESEEPFHRHSRDEAGLAEEAFQLVFPLVVTIEARIKDNRYIMPWAKPRLAEAPAFPHEAPRPIPRDGVRVGTNGYEDGPTTGGSIGHDVDPHALAGIPGSASEDLLDLRPFPDPIRL